MKQNTAKKQAEKRPVAQLIKYGNRKLYNKETTRYISMLELSDLVASGSSVKVTCDLTGRDLTIDNLARALYERVKSRTGLVGSPEFMVAQLENLISNVRVDSKEVR